VAGAALGAGGPGLVLEARGLRFLGRYSYGLYVWHYPVHVGLLRALRGSGQGAAVLAARGGYLAYAAAGAAASLLLALASYHLFEVRFLALKDRLAPRPGIRTSPGGFPG
jgi:peptidoglycan/LPS O-acetylase OafA/YrhL